MAEPERLSEAEATVALDRDDEAGARLVVPENAQLTQEDFDLAAKEYEGTIGEPWGLEYGSYLFSLLSIAQAEKAYPLGFDVGWKARGAEVAELKHLLFAAEELSEMWHLEAIDIKKQCDAALEQVRALVEAGDAILSEPLPWANNRVAEEWNKVAKRTTKEPTDAN